MRTHCQKVTYQEAYKVYLPRTTHTAAELYLFALSRMPGWLRVLSAVRNFFARLVGLKGPRRLNLIENSVQEPFVVGEKLGMFPLLEINDGEVILGQNDRHLDFRLSVSRINRDEDVEITVSTLVQTHNFAGTLYMMLVKPFHILGVRALLKSTQRLAVISDH